MERILDYLFYVFLILTPFFSGLYFEKHFIYALIYLAILIAGYIAYYLVKKIKLNSDKEYEEKIKNKKQKVITYDNKIISKLIILGLLILLISNSTYIINYYFYNEQIDLTLLFYGNMQILEMILLSLVCAIRIKHIRNNKQDKSILERKENLSVILSAIAMGSLIFFNEFYREGRFEATFYYANATAIFFLIAFILLVNTKANNKKEKILKVIISVLLLASLILTNSRFTYILLVMYLGIELLKLIIKKIRNKKDKEKDNNKEKNKYKKIYITIFSILGLSLIALLIIFVLSNEKLTNRFKIDTIERDIKLRYSYIEEANDIILDYPFGLGYEGYLKHNVIKENKYKLRLVHNMPYQLVLNYGFIMLAISLIYFIRYIYLCIKNKKLLSYENVILLLLLLHSLIDIDFSFIYISNIIIMLSLRNVYPDK